MLDEINEKRTTTNAIMKIKLKLIGHPSRHDELSSPTSRKERKQTENESQETAQTRLRRHLLLDGSYNLSPATQENGNRRTR